MIPLTEGEFGHLWPPVPAESTDKSKSLKESPEFSYVFPQEEQTQNDPWALLVQSVCFLEQSQYLLAHWVWWFSKELLGVWYRRWGLIRFWGRLLMNITGLFLFGWKLDGWRKLKVEEATPCKVGKDLFAACRQECCCLSCSLKKIALHWNKVNTTASFILYMLPIEGLLNVQKGLIPLFGPNFHFLQDRANFWQTDLFWHSQLQKHERTGTSFSYWLGWKSKHFNWKVAESLRVFSGKLFKWEPLKSCKIL